MVTFSEANELINAVSGNHSSGTPGGVGRGAASDGIEREESLDRDELAAYLRDLREELTDRYEGMRSNPENADGRPRPVGHVDLIERSSVDDGARRRTVTLRWDVADDADG